MKTEVESPINRISISYNRKGHRAFAVFFCRFLSEYAAGLFLVFIAAPRPLHLDFSISKIQMGGKYAPRKVYIKESGSYVELSYKDFCRRRQADQSYMGKLFIHV